MVPEPAKLVSVPPVVVTSPETKFVDDSLSVKVMVSVEPMFRVVEPALVMATVGATVSTEIESDPPTTFALPAVSVNVLAATDTVAEPVNDAFGVKVAV